MNACKYGCVLDMQFEFWYNGLQNINKPTVFIIEIKYEKNMQRKRVSDLYN